MNEGLRRRALLVSASVLASTALIGIGVASDPGTATSRATAVNGRIVFQAYPGRNALGAWQLYTIRPDGTGLQQVTDIPTGNPNEDPGAENPVWSPDGTTILFAALSHGNPPGTIVNLFTIAPNGTGLAPLPLTVGKFNGDPAYSPDGTQISFDQDVGPSKPNAHGIFIANSDGSNARRLTTGIKTPFAYDTESQWSPDGTTIAFTRVKTQGTDERPGRAAIFTVNVDGTGLRRLTRWKLDVASPDWSPDGTRIAYQSRFDPPPDKSSRIFTMRADGSDKVAITHQKGGRGYSFRPSWSPDGTRIVFTRIGIGPDGYRVGLYTMNPDGTGRTRLTHLPNRAFPVHPDWGTAP